jgi:hypothetical protein
LSYVIKDQGTGPWSLIQNVQGHHPTTTK